MARDVQDEDIYERKTEVMQQSNVLLYGKVCERAVCGEFSVLSGYPIEQDGAILPARDCPFRSRK